MEKLQPILRFPEFLCDWNHFLGNELFNSVTNKNHNSDLPVLAISQEYGAIPRHLIDYKVSVTDKSLESYKIVEVGDFIISLRSFQGGIEYSTYKGICSPAYIILKPIVEIERLFYKYYFKTDKYIIELNKKLEGIRDGKMVSFKYFSEIEIPFPSLPEQQKIASFLSTVDEKIQLLKKQLALLEQYKKGVMQKIFSREIRFKDEEGNEFPEWELITLGECLDYEQPNNYLVDNTEYSDTYPTPVVTAGKTFILGYTNEKNGIFANNLPVIIFDDFTTSSQFVSFPFKAKSSAMKILKAKPLCSVKFLFEALQMIKYEVGGHGRHWISVFSKLEILIPNHIEQQKISSFLSSIDEKIDKNKNQISKMELWKKGLLQQMFC